MKRRGALIALLVSVAVALSGCEESPAPAAPSTEDTPLTAVPNAMLGRAGDSAIFLAVVPGAGSVRVYACDGADLMTATVNQWFSGAFDGTGPVTLRAGGFQVILRADGGGYAGDVVLPDGTALPFTATTPRDGDALLDAELRDPVSGAVTRDGDVIVLGGESRGAMIPTRPRRCRPVQVQGSNGQTTIVTVCS